MTNYDYDIDIKIEVRVLPKEVPDTETRREFEMAEKRADFQAKLLSSSFRHYLRFFVDDYLNRSPLRTNQ